MSHYLVNYGLTVKKGQSLVFVFFMLKNVLQFGETFVEDVIKKFRFEIEM